MTFINLSLNLHKRSFDGLTLYACSSDGSIAVFDFHADELEGIAPTSVQKQYLQKFGFVPPPLPARYVHQHVTHQPPSHSQHDSHMAAVHSQDDGFGANASVNGSGEVNQLVARRGKKRIKPTFVASLTSPSNQNPPSHTYPLPSASQSTMSGPGHPGSLHMSHGYEQAYEHGYDHGYDMSGNGIRLPAPPLQSVTVPSLPTPSGTSISSGHQVFGHPHLPQHQGHQMHHNQWISSSTSYSNNPHAGSPFYVPPPGQAMDISRSSSAEDAAMPTIDAYGPEGKGKGKRRNGDIDMDTPRGRARTLGGDRVRELGPVREISVGEGSGGLSRVDGSGATNVRSAGSRDYVFSVPSVKTYLSVRVEGSEDVLEGSNFDDGSKCMSVSLGRQY